MSTVDKALNVLNLFNESQPKLGLTEIARLMGWDKSNVQRYLSDLTRHGLLQQSPRDKSYALGPALTRLSMMRDLTHPISGALRGALADLVQVSGETAHCSTLIRGKLRMADRVETTVRGTRIYIDPAEPLPFHASASGLAYLSALPGAQAQAILSAPLARYTAQTMTEVSDLQTLLHKIRKDQYAKAHDTYESDVIGIAAPIRGFDGNAFGAVAVAVPASRFSAQKEATISAEVIRTADRISKLHGAA